MASGPVGVGRGILRDGEDLPGRRFDHDDHRLAALVVDGVLSGVLHRPVQADRHRRGRRRLRPRAAREVDVVLVDADHPPARLAVELVDHGLLHLVDQGRREMVVGRQQVGLRGDHHAGQVADRRRDLVVVVGAQRDQVQRVGRCSWPVSASRCGSLSVSSKGCSASTTGVAVLIRKAPALDASSV